MNSKFYYFGLFIILVFSSFLNNVEAAMTSSNYQINWDTISVGGDDSSSSANYILRDSVGNQGTGNSTSTSYSLNSGYRAGVYDRTANFVVYIQDKSSQVAGSAISNTTVTVSSSSGFSVGDMISVIQNEGVNEYEAIGKITSISSSDITVDFWTYVTLQPSFDGTNDYVYLMNATSISLGTLVPGNISTGVVAWEVTADVDDGYSVYLSEDHNLTSGSDSIDDVSDGNVSGVEDEYGARSSDNSLSLSTFDTQDTAITSTLAQVASETDTSFSKRGFVILKATVDGTVPAGTYSQNLRLLYVGDY